MDHYIWGIFLNLDPLNAKENIFGISQNVACDYLKRLMFEFYMRYYNTCCFFFFFFFFFFLSITVIPHYIDIRYYHKARWMERILATRWDGLLNIFKNIAFNTQETYVTDMFKNRLGEAQISATSVSWSQLEKKALLYDGILCNTEFYPQPIPREKKKTLIL